MATKKKSKAKKPKKIKMIKFAKQEVVVATLTVRQLQSRPLLKGAKHIVRLIENCSPRLLSFNSTDELNAWLFEFDYYYTNVAKGEGDTWIDLIFLDVMGDIFDADQLEPRQDV